MSQLLFGHRAAYRLINADEAFDPQKQAHIFWEGTQFWTDFFFHKPGIVFRALSIRASESSAL